MDSQITTIKISKKTKERIEHLRSYKRESYEEIMEKILSVLNLCRLNPEHARAKLDLIDRERKRNLKGRDYMEKDISKNLKEEKAFEKIESKSNINDNKKNKSNIKNNQSQINSLMDKLRR